MSDRTLGARGRGVKREARHAIVNGKLSVSHLFLGLTPASALIHRRFTIVVRQLLREPELRRLVI